MGELGVTLWSGIVQACSIRTIEMTLKPNSFTTVSKLF